MGIFRPNDKIDPLFGRVRFLRSFGLIGGGWWKGAALFPPTGKLVNINVRAGKQGPSGSQRDFYRELLKRYPELLPLVCETMFSTVPRYHGNDFFGGDGVPALVWKDFDLDLVSIPSAENPPAAWGMSYKYLITNEFYWISFEGWNPVFGELDD